MKSILKIEHKTQHAVISHANTSNGTGIKILTFFERSWGMIRGAVNIFVEQGTYFEPT